MRTAKFHTVQHTPLRKILPSVAEETDAQKFQTRLAQK